MGNGQASSFETIGSISGAIASVLLLFFAAWGASKILRKLLRESPEQKETWRETIFLLAGLHIVGLCGLCLGMLGLLRSSKPLILLSAFGAFGIVDFIWNRFRTNKTESVQRNRKRKPSLYWLLIVPPILLTLGPSLNYPTGWDELVYHSVLPRRWLNDGCPTFYVDLPYSGFPSLVELLCWLVASMESVIMSRLFIWVCWLISMFLVFTMVRRQTTTAMSLVLTSALILSPTSLMISANCYVEAFQLMDLIAILLLLEDAGDAKSQRSRNNLILVGIFVGGCSAVKLTGAVVILLPIAWFLMKSLTIKSFLTQRLMPIAVVVVVASVYALPFYTRTWLYSGNPFYPYFADWFSRDTNLTETSFYHHAIGSDPFGMRGSIAFLFTPILIAWDQVLYDGIFGWQWIVALGIIVVGMSNRKARSGYFKRLAFVCSALLFYTFWFSTAQQARFALPFFVTTTLLVTTSLSVMIRRHQVFAGALLVLATTISLPWTHAGYYFASWERILGIWNNMQYVDDTLEVEYVPLVGAIEQHTPADAKLLLLFEQRSMYIPRNCVIGTPFFQAAGLTPPESFSDHNQLMRYIHENAFSHIALALKPMGPDRASPWWNRGEPIFASIERAIELSQLQIQWSTNNYMLLAVEEAR